MFSKRHKNILPTLALASAALSGQALDAQEKDADPITGYDLKGSYLFYQEEDRISVNSFGLSGERKAGAENIYSFRVTQEFMSGPSPNGAVPSDRPYTYTRPSGTPQEIGSNELPADKRFSEHRTALDGQWTHDFPSFFEFSLGGHLSVEDDYRSLGANTNLAYDLNGKNTRLTSGLSYSLDTVVPKGGFREPFEPMREPVDKPPEEDEMNKQKSVVDLLFGINQVIDAHSLVQLNYGFGASEGYLTDPYRLISVVGTDGRPVLQTGYSVNLPLALSESRPENRQKHIIYTQYKRSLLERDVLELSYRFMADSWGINSHTMDTRYKAHIGEKSFLQFHLRYYYQTEADFYTAFYKESQQPGQGEEEEYGSSDYRLGEMSSYTVGIEYGQNRVSYPFSVAVEYYLQATKEPQDKFGELLNQELNPDLKVIIFRINLDF